MKLPSKELLSAVLEIDYSFKSIEYFEYDSLLTWYRNEVYKEHVFSINIYELMHKMKEWAYTLGYVISVQYKTDYADSNKSLAWIESLKFEGRKNFKADTEFEAVTKACEWILKETK